MLVFIDVDATEDADGVMLLGCLHLNGLACDKGDQSRRLAEGILEAISTRLR